MEPPTHLSPTTTDTSKGPPHPPGNQSLDYIILQHITKQLWDQHLFPRRCRIITIGQAGWRNTQEEMNKPNCVTGWQKHCHICGHEENVSSVWKVDECEKNCNEEEGSRHQMGRGWGKPGRAGFTGQLVSPSPTLLWHGSSWVPWSLTDCSKVHHRIHALDLPSQDLLY